MQVGAGRTPALARPARSDRPRARAAPGRPAAPSYARTRSSDRRRAAARSCCRSRECRCPRTRRAPRRRRTPACRSAPGGRSPRAARPSRVPNGEPTTIRTVVSGHRRPARCEELGGTATGCLASAGGSAASTKISLPGATSSAPEQPVDLQDVLGGDARVAGDARQRLSRRDHVPASRGALRVQRAPRDRRGTRPARAPRSRPAPRDPASSHRRALADAEAAEEVDVAAAGVIGR